MPPQNHESYFSTTFDIPPQFKSWKTWVYIITAIVIVVSVWRVREYRKPVQNKTAEAVESGDLERCSSIDEDMDGINYKTVCRNNIFLQRAFANTDFAPCQSLDDNLMLIHDCEDTILTLLLQKEKAPSACERAPERLKTACRDSYWSGEARAQNDPQLCENISAEQARENCEKHVLTSFVSDTKTPDCSRFTTKPVQRECENYRKGNCRELSDPRLQDLCGQNILP